MALNFPSSPSEGQVFSGYVFTGGLWRSAPIRTALPFNYFVNPSMQVSQENGNTAGTGSGRYGADQFGIAYVGTAVLTTQRVQVVTPKGSLNRYRVTVTTADAALAATDYGFVIQSLEGYRITDFLWGTAQAQQAVLRFGFKGPAGTYAISFRNNGTTRAYIALFTIAAGQANTDTEQLVIIPGDTTGTWSKDANVGMFFAVTFAAGTTYQSTNNAWSAGNFLGAAGISNGIGTTSAVFELFDFGLYRDPYLTGKAPPWEANDALRDQLECFRYFNKFELGVGGEPAATTAGRVGMTHPVTMRAAPTLALTAAMNAYTTGVGGFLTALGGSYANDRCVEFDGTISGSHTASRALVVQSNVQYIKTSARM